MGVSFCLTTRRGSLTADRRWIGLASLYLLRLVRSSINTSDRQRTLDGWMDGRWRCLLRTRSSAHATHASIGPDRRMRSLSAAALQHQGCLSIASPISQRSLDWLTRHSRSLLLGRQLAWLLPPTDMMESVTRIISTTTPYGVLRTRPRHCHLGPGWLRGEVRSEHLFHMRRHVLGDLKPSWAIRPLRATEP